jgi:hypothetical protein
MEQERLQGFLGSLLRVQARLFIEAIVQQHVRGFIDIPDARMRDESGPT